MKRKLEKWGENRILSSVMRKAGFNMTETNFAKEKNRSTIKRIATRTKRFIGLAAAAAIAMTGAVGAAAHYGFFYRGSVENFIENADSLDKNAEDIIKVDEYALPLENPLDGMTAVLSFEKNCETATLTNYDGNTVLISQFEIISSENIISENGGQVIRLIKTDGKKEKIDGKKIYSSTDNDGKCYTVFGKFIDLDDYKGVEIEGVEYLK